MQRRRKRCKGTENDAKVRKTMQGRRKRCKGTESDAKVQKTMQRHGKRCKRAENDAKALKTMQGCGKQNGGQVAGMGVAIRMRNAKNTENTELVYLDMYGRSKSEEPRRRLVTHVQGNSCIGCYSAASSI